MTIYAQEVDCFNLHDKPKKNETIEDYIDTEKGMKFAKSFHYYYRSPEECPFNRGNWILDIELKTGENSSNWICFKFPKEMTEEEFIKFLNPLFKLKGFKKLT